MDTRKQQFEKEARRDKEHAQKATIRSGKASFSRSQNQRRNHLKNQKLKRKTTIGYKVAELSYKASTHVRVTMASTEQKIQLRNFESA